MRASYLESNNHKTLLHRFALRAVSSNNSLENPAISAVERITGGSQIRRGTVLKTFAVLAVVTFLLRIFYAGHLYQDDGLWFAAAEEINRGKALYGEIYFDKPPLLPLVYALLFKLFGAHIITIRVFTVIYSLTISSLLYLFGSWLYQRRIGFMAAAMFTVFSTTYQEGHFQGLNTDFLMLLPYTAGAYLLLRSQATLFNSRVTEARSRLLILAGGALVGVAFQTNPKAIFGLLFFAVFLIVIRRWRIQILAQLALATAGFIAGALPFWIYIAQTGSLDEYNLYVLDWGARYTRYYPAGQIALSAVRQTIDYFALNNTLAIALIFVAATVIKQAKGKREKVTGTEPATGASFTAHGFKADAALLIWLASSYTGLALGGRFFGHYFFQILPSLCLIGARGLAGISDSLRPPAQETESRDHKRAWAHSLIARRVVWGAIALGFIVTLVRFHTRTITLAADWVRGTKSAATARWFHDELNHEERMVAAVIKDLPGGVEAADFAGLEAMRFYGRETYSDERDISSRYLFVWGYRPEIYYWTGLAPASRYLSTQPLTGVPADVHYFGDDYRSLLGESETARARANLLQDLERTRPEYIVDELGFFNSHLSINSFPELREFMSGYKPMGAVGRFFIYRNKQFVRKYRERNAMDAP